MDNLDTFDDHPSLSASLEDFEHHDRSPTFGVPSQHSGFKSDDSEPEVDAQSDGPWSPPAWGRQTAEAGWYQHQPYAQDSRHLKPSMSRSRSRNTSPQYRGVKEDEGDTVLPANIPLPKGSMSPVKEQSPSAEPTPSLDAVSEGRAQSEQPSTGVASPNNCGYTYVRRADQNADVG